MCLQELGYQIWMTVEEGFPGDHYRCGELVVRPERALIDQHLALIFLDQARCPRFWHPGTIDLSLLEPGQDIRVLCRDNLHRTTFIDRIQAVLLKIVP